MAAPTFDDAFRGRVMTHVRAYARPKDAIAAAHLAATVALFAAGLAAHRALAPRAVEAAKALASAPGLASGARALAFALALLVVTLVQAGTNVKLFMIHHDLVHGGFLSRARWQAPLAALTGSLIHVSPTVWRREHERHHRTSNDLDQPQDGQTASWTVARYLSAPRWQRIAYRVGNAPLVLFGLVPLFYFLVFMRLRARWWENAMVVALWVVLFRLGLLEAHLVPLALAAAIGFVIFHAQHTFEGAYRRRARAWDFFENAMLGSSLLVLPGRGAIGAALRFFAHGVEYHHVHHLSPRTPGYRLAACHRDGGALFDACPRVSFADALRTAHYNLYDEDRDRFVDARRLARP